MIRDLINQQFFEPIPADMVRTFSISPLVTLKKNGLYAACQEGVCDFEIEAQTNFPHIIDIDYFYGE